MRMVDALERAELHWCAIGGIAVNHWAAEPMVTRDVDFVVAVDEFERAVAALEAVGFEAERPTDVMHAISGDGSASGAPRTASPVVSPFCPRLLNPWSQDC